MLTTLEANFVQELKVTGSPTKAMRAVGCKSKSENYLKLKAYRWMQKPHIKQAVAEYSNNLHQELITPVITKTVPMMTKDDNGVITPRVIQLPTREQYADLAWKRASDDSKLKDDLKHKYYETAGKTLKYIGSSESEEKNISTFNIIAQELKITLPENPANQLPSVQQT